MLLSGSIYAKRLKWEGQLTNILPYEQEGHTMLVGLTPDHPKDTLPFSVPSITYFSCYLAM
jgi:hypothetical protein